MQDPSGGRWRCPCRSSKPKAPAAAKPAGERTRGERDCRFTGNCRCTSHLGAGYWLQQERRARRFADEMERLDREDPEEARRRDRELLKPPPLDFRRRRRPRAPESA